jgi:hypothetical protein
MSEFEFYPEEKNNEINPFYVEFHQFDNGPITWTLFKEQSIYSDEQWESIQKETNRDFDMFKLTRWGHPWNLGGGEVDRDGCMGFTKDFLKFMVEALNEKYQREINK